MTGIESKARRIGERAAVRTRARVAAVLRERLGEGVSETGEDVAIRGRRWDDPALRWIAGLLK